MKKTTLVSAMALLLVTLLAAPPARAKVEVQSSPAVKTASPPIDLALSADGQRTFVLSQGGLVTIYGRDGNVVDTFKVDPGADRITVDGNASQLYLSSNKKGTINQVFLQYQADMDYTGSPFQGKAEAPVVLAVFSDFQ